MTPRDEFNPEVEWPGQTQMQATGTATRTVQHARLSEQLRSAAVSTAAGSPPPLLSLLLENAAFEIDRLSRLAGEG